MDVCGGIQQDSTLQELPGVHFNAGSYRMADMCTAMLPRKPRLLIIDLLLLRTLRLIPILPDRASVGM